MPPWMVASMGTMDATLSSETTASTPSTVTEVPITSTVTITTMHSTRKTISPTTQSAEAADSTTATSMWDWTRSPIVTRLIRSEHSVSDRHLGAEFADATQPQGVFGGGVIAAQLMDFATGPVTRRR